VIMEAAATPDFFEVVGDVVVENLRHEHPSLCEAVHYARCLLRIVPVSLGLCREIMGGGIRVSTVYYIETL
jgi:hypothetical protein